VVPVGRTVPPRECRVHKPLPTGREAEASGWEDARKGVERQDSAGLGVGVPSGAGCVSVLPLSRAFNSLPILK
jgi:hypothetical protein